MIYIKVLHVISGNDDGGGGVHVLNTFKSKIEDLDLELCLIGNGGLEKKASKENQLFMKVENKIQNNDLVRIINEGNYNIVNFHGARACLIHKFIKKKLNTRTVVTIHSNFNKDFDNQKGIKRWISTFLYKNSLRSFESFIAVSDYLEDLLKKEKMTESAPKVYNGVDINKLISSKELEYRQKEEAFIFGSIARFHPVKNHENMIRALSMLIKDGIKARLVLIGNGSLEERAKVLVKELNIEESVVFLGYKENAFRYLPSFDVNVLTSFDEGGIPPLAVLEGFAFEKTSVISDINSVRDILGNVAYYIDPNKVETIYEAMKAAYEDKKRREKEVRCKEILCEKFSVESFCNRYFNAYKGFLAGGNNER